MDKEKFYLSLCEKVDNIIKQDNPCEFIDGKCIVARSNPANLLKYSSCCRKCINQSLEGKGCTIKSLGCKLYFCLKAESRISEVNLRVINIIKNMAKEAGIIALLGEEF